MGDPYDGRATDSWALGVLLYTLIEGRLPFDPVPHIRSLRAPKKHRIAGCKWLWLKYADEQDEWDPVKGKDLDGAEKIVAGLLVKSRRWNLDNVQETEWVQGAINVDGGLTRQEDGDED